IGASHLTRTLGTIPRTFAIKALSWIELLVARSSFRPGKELVSLIRPEQYREPAIARPGLPCVGPYSAQFDFGHINVLFSPSSDKFRLRSFPSMHNRFHQGIDAGGQSEKTRLVGPRLSLQNRSHFIRNGPERERYSGQVCPLSGYRQRQESIGDGRRDVA